MVSGMFLHFSSFSNAEILCLFISFTIVCFICIKHTYMCAVTYVCYNFIWYILVCMCIYIYIHTCKKFTLKWYILGAVYNIFNSYTPIICSKSYYFIWNHKYKIQLECYSIQWKWDYYENEADYLSSDSNYEWLQTEKICSCWGLMWL